MKAINYVYIFLLYAQDLKNYLHTFFLKRFDYLPYFTYFIHTFSVSRIQLIDYNKHDFRN